MGNCPHCEFTGNAHIEWIQEPDYETPTGAFSGSDTAIGQMVCPDCDTILGGVYSKSSWAHAP